MQGVLFWEGVPLVFGAKGVVGLWCRWHLLAATRETAGRICTLRAKWRDSGINAKF